MDLLPLFSKLTGRAPLNLILLGLLLLPTGLGRANPAGGTISSGSATISNSTGTTTINQSSSAAIINWQSFSINQGESTHFLQPNSQSATLNRVMGGGGISQINGSLTANGKVYLINQNGILVGPSGFINAEGGFTASTRDISDSDFLAGKQHFMGHGNAGIQNAGQIHTALGNVVLIGKTVSNKGKIGTRAGSVDLAAGDDVLLAQRNADGSTIVVAPTPLARNDLAKTGISNTGSIWSTSAKLKATNGNIYALAINNGGAIRATTVSHLGGQILLSSDNGDITNSGALSASSRQVNGDGGTVRLKSGGTVSHSGLILAHGGVHGTGGNVVISGSDLDFTGYVILGSTYGTTGDLLLDAPALNISTGGTGIGTIIEPEFIDLALQTTNLNLNADNSITISNAISWPGVNKLTLSTNVSGSTIAINAPISSYSALIINTAGTNDVITPGANGDIKVVSFTLQNGDWNQNADGGTLANFVTGRDFELQGASTFLRVAGGDGSSEMPYLISDVYGLQGIGSPSNALLGFNYQQSGNIDASGTEGWNSGLGFSPIGNDYLSMPFSGIYNGEDYTINRLTIDRPIQNEVGLFGYATGSTLEGIGLVGETVSGGFDVGGLVGYNTGTVQSSYSTGAVSGTRVSSFVGGLAGDNYGTIETSYATSAVGGYYYVGGLVGSNDGDVEMSYATGSVNGYGGIGANRASNIGGLAGSNTGIVQSSYATGGVVAYNDVGGLVGINSGALENSYATGAVNGYGDNIGGLVGENDAGTVETSYATGAVTATINNSNIGGLVGQNYGGTVETSYAIGAVTGFDNVGGLVGNNSGTVTASYWATDAGGLNASLSTIDSNSGTVDSFTSGETLAQLKTQSTFQPQGTGEGNWDFTLGTGVWGINGYTSNGLVNNGLPYFQWQYPTQAKITANSQQLTYSGTTGTLNQSLYTVSYNPNNTTGQNSISNLLSSGPILSVQGSNMNVVNSGAANTVGVSVTPTSGSVVEVDTAPATVTYTPATLTLTANGASKVYGNNNPALGGNVTGFVNGETLSFATTGTLTFSSTAGQFSGVGNYAILGSGLSVPSGNYVLTQAASNGTALSITPKPVTVTSENLSALTFGTDPDFNISISGLVNGDSLGISSYSTNAGKSAGGYYNAGSYIYFPVLTANPNYSVSATLGTFSIAPATLTYVANPTTGRSCETIPNLSGTVEGFLPGEDAGNSTSGNLSFATSAGSSSAQGTYAINGEGLSAGNYIFAQAPENSDALTLLPPPFNPALHSALADSNYYAAYDYAYNYAFENAQANAKANAFNLAFAAKYYAQQQYRHALAYDYAYDYAYEYALEIAHANAQARAHRQANP